MKKIIASALAILMWFGSSAVLADPDKPRVFQAAEIIPNPNDLSPGAEGAAWLRRSKNKVEGRVMARVDTANQPYTIWWIIFNNPKGCSDPCGEDDVFNASFGAEADVAVFNASGAISASTGAGGGVINVDLSVIGGEGAGIGSKVDPSGGAAAFFSRVLKKNNGMCSEIHLDINRHDKNVDWVTELTTPETGHAFAVFPPTDECKKKKKKK
jgi:hypothetical protein